MLATTAMIGANFHCTFNIFLKQKYIHIYEPILATPIPPLDDAHGELL